MGNSDFGLINEHLLAAKAVAKRRRLDMLTYLIEVAIYECEDQQGQPEKPSRH